MGWRIDPESVETSALKELAPVPGLRVLELGCGDGRAHSTAQVTGAARIATAVSRSYVDAANGR